MIKLAITDCGSTGYSPVDMVDEAMNLCLQRDQISASIGQIDELNTVVDNLLLVSKMIQTSNDVHGTLEALDAVQSIEALLGIAANKLTVKAATEGLGKKIIDGIKNMLKAIREFISKIIDHVRSWFTKASTKQLKSDLKDAEESAKKNRLNAEIADRGCKLIPFKKLKAVSDAYISDSRTGFASYVLDIPDDISKWSDDEAEAQAEYNKSCENPDWKKIYAHLSNEKGIDIVGVGNASTGGVKGAVGFIYGDAHWNREEGDPDKLGYNTSGIEYLSENCDLIFEFAGDGSGRSKVIDGITKSLQDTLAEIKRLESSATEDDLKRVKVLKIKVKALHRAESIAIQFASFGYDIIRVIKSQFQAIK